MSEPERSEFRPRWFRDASAEDRAAFDFDLVVGSQPFVFPRITTRILTERDEAVLSATALNEIIEKVTAVVRARCGFRVVLYREGRFPFHADPFNGVIVQIEVCDLDMVRFFHRFRVNSETVVLRTDLAPAGNQVFYRVVKTAVSVVHFVSRYS